MLDGVNARTGWVDKDPEVLAEYALDMAEATTEVAHRYPPGAKVRAVFDRDTREWTITGANQCDIWPSSLASGLVADLELHPEVTAPH